MRGLSGWYLCSGMDLQDQNLGILGAAREEWYNADSNREHCKIKTRRPGFHVAYVE
jgi:hypothetical protein